MIKERVRSIIHGLPYFLPPSLMKYCVMFAVSSINLIRHSDASGLSISPKELFTGRRTDFKTDLRVSFGGVTKGIVHRSANRFQDRPKSEFR
jgi:hypothetical protein